MHYIKLVIFDLDGTLVDSIAELVAATNHVRSVFGLPQFTECEVRKMLGNGGQRLVEKALPEAGPAELKRADAEYLLYSEVHLLTSTRTYPGVVDTLAELKRNGVPMAIISSKHSMLSRKLLRRLGIDAYFLAILGSDSLPFRKPSPELILKLLGDLRMDACEGVIVGDSMSDILAGKRAGVVTVGCSYGYGNASELTHADYRISSMPELLRLPLFGKLTCQTVEKPSLRLIF
jgi:phosphoglycolate phosphatase